MVPGTAKCVRNWKKRLAYAHRVCYNTPRKLDMPAFCRGYMRCKKEDAVHIMEDATITNAVQPEPVKKKKSKLLAILIPVVLVLVIAGVVAGILISRDSQYEKALQLLDDGEFEEAIAIHQKLGDYKDLEDEINSEFASQCKKLLKKGSYSKIAKLYATAAGYSKAIKSMDKRMQEHVEELTDNGDYDALIEISEEFAAVESVQAMALEAIGVYIDNEIDETVRYGYCDDLLEMYYACEDNKALQDMILEKIEGSVDRMWEDSYWTALNLYTQLVQDDVYMEAMDEKIAAYISDQIQSWDYYSGFSYIFLITHNQAAMDEVDKAIVAFANSCLEQGYYWDVRQVYNLMDEYSLNRDALSQAIYEFACQRMEQEDYSSAEDFFELLGEYSDSAEKLDQIAFAQVVSTMRRYMDYGWYSDARYLINSYEGEKQQALIDVFLEYSADNTVLADLEAALLARLAVSEAGGSMLEVVAAEWEYIQKYQYMPFYDTNLEELFRTYWSALDQQESVASYYLDYGWYDYYEATYHWNLAAATRYEIMDLLHEQYGFANAHPELLEQQGRADQLRQWTEAWYYIHGCLSYYLWDVSPYEQDGVYYLDLYNYTDYTFSIVVGEEFHDYSDELLGEYTGEYLSIAPGQTVQVVVGYPQDFYGYWYIDWNIYDIYYNGVLLDY